jgi:hypothetical protein
MECTVYKEICILRSNNSLLFLCLTTVKEHLFMVILSHFRHMLGGNLKMQHADWLKHCKALPVGYVVKWTVE